MFAGAYPTGVARSLDQLLVIQTDENAEVHVRRVPAQSIVAFSDIQEGITAIVGGQTLAVALTAKCCVFRDVPSGGGGRLIAPVGVSQEIFNRGGGGVVEVFPRADCVIEGHGAGEGVPIASGGSARFLNTGTIVLIS